MRSVCADSLSVCAVSDWHGSTTSPGEPAALADGRALSPTGCASAAALLHATTPASQTPLSPRTHMSLEELSAACGIYISADVFAERNRALAFWTDTLGSGCEPVLFPTGRPRQTVAPSLQSGSTQPSFVRCSRTVPTDVVRRLRATCLALVAPDLARIFCLYVFSQVCTNVLV